MEIKRILPKAGKNDDDFNLPILKEGLYVLGVSYGEPTEEDINKLVQENTLEDDLYYYNGKLTTNGEKLRKQLYNDYRVVKYTIERLPIQK